MRSLFSSAELIVAAFPRRSEDDGNAVMPGFIQYEPSSELSFEGPGSSAKRNLA